MIQRKQKHFGFTLIEVMAVIAIISIMTSILFVSFDGPKKQTYLDNARRQFITDLRFLQQSTLSGTVPSGISGSVCGHGLHRNGTGYQFFVITKVHAGGDCSNAYSKIFATGNSYGSVKTFERGVALGTAPDLYFETPHAKVYSNGAEGNVSYTLNLDSESLQVCVSSSGNIKEGGC
jgi:prepilin-type N-terminal cleavage/methylation domain-containing protein